MDGWVGIGRRCWSAKGSDEGLGGGESGGEGKGEDKDTGEGKGAGVGAGAGVRAYHRPNCTEHEAPVRTPGARSRSAYHRFPLRLRRRLPRPRLPPRRRRRRLPRRRRYPPCRRRPPCRLRPTGRQAPRGSDVRARPAFCKVAWEEEHRAEEMSKGLVEAAADLLQRYRFAWPPIERETAAVHLDGCIGL